MSGGGVVFVADGVAWVVLLVVEGWWFWWWRGGLGGGGTVRVVEGLFG